MQQNGELSVEEILESIKKVIARDNKESAAVERRTRETEGVVLRGPGAFNISPMAQTGNDDEPDEDELIEDDAGEVLDLSDAATEMFDEETTGEAPLDLIEPAAGEAAAEPESLPDAPLTIQTQTEELAAPMVRNSLEALTTMSETPLDPETAQPAATPETPLERMVRESLRPLIREWLDANLERMVERMVQAEIERAIGKLT